MSVAFLCQIPRKARLPMPTKISSGFPLRRCSWAYDPIVSVALTHKMVRWLDSVCLKQVTFKARI